jgi:hypothetical protein
MLSQYISTHLYLESRFNCFEQIQELMEDDPEAVSEGLWALSCGPCLRVKFAAACKINGERYSTVDREKFMPTQNSGIMTEGSHNNEDIDFYGQLKEVIELSYNSNFQSIQTVVLF